MVSLYDTAWCSSPGVANAFINNNIMLGQADGLPAGGGGGGINLVGLDTGIIAGNRIEGFGDDGIALFNSKRCLISANRVKGVRSRIGVFSGNDHLIIGNYLERQAGHDGIWYASQPGRRTSFYTSFLASDADPAPENIKFMHNTAVLPASAPDFHIADDFLSLGGVRGCVASGNIFINDSNQTERPRLRVWMFTVFQSWQDPAGKDPRGQSRPHSIILTNNILSGQYPGEVVEGPDNLASDLPGPMIYQGNIASKFTWVLPRATFCESCNMLV